MFDRRDAPLQILQNPTLGDPLFVCGEPLLTEPAEGPGETDHRIERLEGWVGVLEARIARLEQQTPRAYWRRFMGWLRGCWPWR